jgi:hypothetical protein
MSKEVDAVVGPLAMTQLEVEFNSEGVSREMIAVEVAKNSGHYVPMRKALAEKLMTHRPLPDGCTVAHAKQAVAGLLDLFTQPAGNATAGTGTGPDLSAVLERFASSLAEGIAAQPKDGGSAGVSKLTHAEVQEGILKVGEMGYPMSEQDLPRMEQMGKAKNAILARSGETAKPQLPVEPATQPRSLAGLQDERGQWAEEEVREIVWDEATQKQVSRAPSTPAKGYTRTAYSVAQGHLYYWHSVLLIATMIKNLPERPDAVGAETRKAGVWLHPYYVIKFGKMLSAVVGRQTMSGPGLEDLLRPLLHEAQNRVNHKGMSADVALAWIIDEMPVRLATVAASKTENDVRKQKENDNPNNKNNKRRRGDEKEKVTTPNAGVHKKGQTCSTCGGMCSHITGRCWKCRSKDQAQVKAPAAPPVKAAGAQPVAGAGQ